MVNVETPDQPTRGRIVGSEHRLPVRIYYEDTDAGGVVYHANFLRFMERARSDMLALGGIDQRSAIESGAGGFVVAEVAIRYRRPAKLDDVLVIVSRVRDTKASSCVIHQRVMRGDELVAEADVAVVLVGADGRPRRQPPAWLDAFRRLQGEEETV
jgi:acyl-CoA thioester hydrolase